MSGITDYELYADAKSDRIIVRFPWKEDSDQNAIEAIEEISSTAQLTFRPGDGHETTDVDSNGEYVYKTPSGDTAKTILMDGSYVESATAGMSNPEDTAEMLHEMATVGVTMALLVTAVWCVMLVVSSVIEKKAQKTQQDKISD